VDENFVDFIGVLIVDEVFVGYRLPDFYNKECFWGDICV